MPGLMIGASDAFVGEGWIGDGVPADNLPPAAVGYPYLNAGYYPWLIFLVTLTCSLV